jgi:hypothetical protein
MPRLSTRRRVALALPFVVIAWIVAFSIDREYEQRTTLAEGISFVETVHVTRTPYAGMAEAGSFFILPFPNSSADVIAQELRRGQTVIWSGTGEDRYDFHISPDRAYAAGQHRPQSKPWLIIDLERGTTVTVGEPSREPRMHDYSFPLQFGGWSTDSRTALGVVEGSVTNDRGESRRYREVWSVDPVTGAATRLHDCELPSSEQPDWSTTECTRGPVR